MSYCSVIIPTKNAMPRFARVLEAVLQQRTPWPFDVIVIDSGSRDGTVAYARAQSRVQVIEIPPQEFGHGRTRNRAIAATDAPYVALLTHDAEPLNEDWLANLVAAVEQDDRIAGAFGRHVAYPDASPFTKRDLEFHFANFLAHPLIVSKDTDPERFRSDTRWQQFLHFFSDNNACLRRSVWQQIPYPDVDFAEDQLWARQIIHAGYAKAYAPEAVVYHSHDYALFERLQRSFDESGNFRSHFGYELAPSFWSALRSISGLTARDLLHGRKTPEITTLQCMRQVLLNVMHVSGLYLGNHAARIPKDIRFRLSRDKRLQYS